MKERILTTRKELHCKICGNTIPKGNYCYKHRIHYFKARYNCSAKKPGIKVDETGIKTRIKLIRDIIRKIETNTAGMYMEQITLLTKAAESYFSGRKDKELRKYELEKTRLKTEIKAKIEPNQTSYDYLKLKSEVEEEKYCQQPIKKIDKPIGIRWLEASISLVIALFGFSAVGIFIASAINLWTTANFLLTPDQFSEAFFAVLFYFLQNGV